LKNLSWKKKILLALAIVFIGIQCYKVDLKLTNNLPSEDLIAMYQPNAKITSILKTACYDCHSNNTQFPWYNTISPVQWWLADHINHGKKHLNFSAWGTYSNEKANHKLEECFEELEKENMPLNSYTWTHSEARLSETQRSSLINWFSELRN
jgi:hypothetical protein